MLRPAHLAERTITRTFGESADLITRSPGGRDNTGAWNPGTETTTTIMLSTAPGQSLSDSEQRAVTEAGVRLDAARLFWLAQAVKPESGDDDGDRIRYGGELFRVHSVQAWGTFWTALGVRVEPQ